MSRPRFCLESGSPGRDHGAEITLSWLCNLELEHAVTETAESISGVSILHCRPFHLTATVPLTLHYITFISSHHCKKIFSSHIVCKYLFSAPSRIPHVPESGHSWGLELQNFCKPWLTGGSYLWRTGIFIGVMCAEFCTDWPPPLGRDLHAR